MKQLTIGIFHDDHLAQDLGKRATESDMILYHRKFDDLILSFIHPVEDKLTVFHLMKSFIREQRIVSINKNH